MSGIILFIRSHSPFWMFFKIAAKKKDKMPIWCNISVLPSVMLNFMSRPSVLKILNSISDIKKAKHKALTYCIEDDSQLNYNFCIFSLILRKFP